MRRNITTSFVPLPFPIGEVQPTNRTHYAVRGVVLGCQSSSLIMLCHLFSAVGPLLRLELVYEPYKHANIADGVWHRDFVIFFMPCAAAHGGAWVAKDACACRFSGNRVQPWAAALGPRLSMSPRGGWCALHLTQ